MTIRDMLATARAQLETATRAQSGPATHPDFQSSIQALFNTVNRLTAFGHDAPHRHADGYDPTCDLCTR